MQWLTEFCEKMNAKNKNHLRKFFKNYCKAGFPLREFVRVNREKINLTGWRQTLTSSSANHIRFLLVRANKFAKWKTGLTCLRYEHALSESPWEQHQHWKVCVLFAREEDNI